MTSNDSCTRVQCRSAPQINRPLPDHFESDEPVPATQAPHHRTQASQVPKPKNSLPYHVMEVPPFTLMRSGCYAKNIIFLIVSYVCLQAIGPGYPCGPATGCLPLELQKVDIRDQIKVSVRSAGIHII